MPVRRKHLEPFAGPDHEPFLRHGVGRGAVLLLHGFPGTPAELRPLARSLHQAGWTVHAPLLPGFGPQIHQLADNGLPEWSAAVREAHRRLAEDGGPVYVLGYSMGGALAIIETAECQQPPAGLILAAPFHRLLSRAQALVWPLAKVFGHSFRPFDNADFSNPHVRREVARCFPGADLDDPATLENLRSISVPLAALSQLRRTGRRAYRTAPLAAVPTLVLQGQNDEVTSPQRTEELVARLGGPVRHVILDAGHDLLDPEKPAWPELESSVLAFLARD